ncbi:MAG: 50S ribosomal protein L3 [Pseudomonadota bacterium]
MTVGLVGQKVGMTRIFSDDGLSTPVTVIEVQPNRITQVRTVETDGYRAIQVTTGHKKPSRVNLPMKGHYAKAKTEAGRGLWEFRLPVETQDEWQVGDALDTALLTVGNKVDVRGMSKGKGFQGGVKRHNFRTQDNTHGNSLSHRAPGSIGQCQTPGRVFKGKKMAGHMGAEKVCTQNLEVVRIDPERQLVLIKGAVPGANGGNVIITPAIKQRQKG